MTTIAYRDGVLAADTCISHRGTVLGFAPKVIKRGPVLAGFFGDHARGRKFLDWVRGGCADGAPYMGHFDQDAAFGVLIPPQGLVLVCHPTGWEQLNGPFWAGGSGDELARGAMAAGATAEEAVRHAMTHDLATSGEILTVRHDVRAALA